MNLKEYAESIKIDTKEEYREYQDMLCKKVKEGLSNNKDTIELTWKDNTVTIDLNHSSFLVGYNYGVTTTLIDFENEKKHQNKEVEQNKKTSGTK